MRMVILATAHCRSNMDAPLALCPCTLAQAGAQTRACGKARYLYAQRCRNAR